VVTALAVAKSFCPSCGFPQSVAVCDVCGANVAIPVDLSDGDGPDYDTTGEGFRRDAHARITAELETLGEFRAANGPEGAGWIGALTTQSGARVTLFVSIVSSTLSVEALVAKLPKKQRVAAMRFALEWAQQELTMTRLSLRGALVVARRLDKLAVLSSSRLRAALDEVAQITARCGEHLVSDFEARPGVTDAQRATCGFGALGPVRRLQRVVPRERSVPRDEEPTSPVAMSASTKTLPASPPPVSVPAQAAHVTPTPVVTVPAVARTRPTVPTGTAPLASVLDEPPTQPERPSPIVRPSMTLGAVSIPSAKPNPSSASGTTKAVQAPPPAESLPPPSSPFPRALSLPESAKAEPPTPPAPQAAPPAEPPDEMPAILSPMFASPAASPPASAVASSSAPVVSSQKPSVGRHGTLSLPVPIPQAAPSSSERRTVPDSSATSSAPMKRRSIEMPAVSARAQTEGERMIEPEDRFCELLEKALTLATLLGPRSDTTRWLLRATAFRAYYEFHESVPDAVAALYRATARDPHAPEGPIQIMERLVAARGRVAKEKPLFVDPMTSAAQAKDHAARYVTEIEAAPKEPALRHFLALGALAELLVRTKLPGHTEQRLRDIVDHSRREGPRQQIVDLLVTALQRITSG
jgi:hypothetical protein